MVSVHHDHPLLPASRALERGSTRTQADLMRSASLILGDRRRAQSIVSTVLDRADDEDGNLEWNGVISREIWLHTLTVRACRSWFDGLVPSRVWARAREAEHAWDACRVHIDIDRLTVLVEQPAELRHALLELPTGDRIVLVLHDALCLPLHECAQITRSPAEITARHLTRARQNLLLELAGSSPAREGLEADRGRPSSRQSLIDAHTILSTAVATLT